MLKKRLYIILLILCLGLTIQAQTTITIGGNVYGGGNEGDLGGCTSVVVREGDIGSVYAGARQANIAGNTFVNIDGEHMSGDILINYVYGGNDIAGTIGSLANLSLSTLPSGLTKAATYGIDNTYNCFVLTTKEKTVTVGETTSQPYKIFIGQLFGGGNGDYTYDTGGIVPPEIDKAYIEMRGGSCVLLYGGGNNVTVKKATDICIDNPSTVTDNIYVRDADGKETTTSKLTDTRLKAMGVYQLGGAGENVATSDAYQFSRVFGGNNKAPMAIRPKWHLEQGKIRNLYSGGNRGAMTYEKGIYLAVNSDKMEINNVYGGCRMADVNPDKHEILEETIEGVLCPAGYAARVHIGGGNINNVYGGNDISGTIYGGNAVGIHSSINKDVYGGGNGSYPYTDNADLVDSDIYGDYYYTVPAGKRSVDALNDFRPNAEAVSVRLIGQDAEHPTIIGGSVFCGGNSATLRSASGSARAQLKIGAYVYADKVFLGSNGENMLKYNDKSATEMEGVLRTMASINKTSDGSKFNSITLVGENNVFADYMKGCEIGIKPEVVFDTDYSTNNKKFTTYFGSFFCGGNVGSVNRDGVFEINFSDKVVIFNKVVGGSNDAYVKASAYNAPYEGGLLGSADATTGDKLRLTFNGLKIEPKRWKDVNDKTKLLEWNLNDATDDENRRLLGGNIYGGCYNSGHVNGNVVINIENSIAERDELFDAVKGDGKEGIYYSDKYDYTVKEGGTKTGVQLGRQGMDVEGVALNVFGGGYGKDSEIWGSTTINLKKGYAFQLFGGGEQGAIGKKKMKVKADGTPDLDSNGGYQYEYEYDPQCSTYINIIGTGTNSAGVSMQASNPQPTDMPECEFVYGGGFEGLITGDTHINLGNGRVFNTFAGSCNADVLGHTETYIGKDGFPWVRDHVYGGNDLGGSILNLQQTGTGAVTTNDFVGRVNVADKTKLHKYNSTAGTSDMFIASAYMEYVQGRVDRVFGGCYGDYDYTEFPGVNRPYMDNTFVNFRPNNNAANAVSAIFGAGQGATGTSASANLQDAMQDRSYVLINIPDALENYKTTDVFGAGACCGVGMRYTKTQTRASTFDLDKATAIVDLIGGHIRDAYGSSYEEGFTRRTMVNVPAGSTIHLSRIFGGGYGLRNSSPCDTYEAIVNYNSSNAVVGGYKTGIFGGNNNFRRTLYSKVNINAPTWSNDAHTTLATVFGAGLGENTWSQYTEVNLNDHAQVYEVYGGGNAGMVLNAKSVNAWDTYTEEGETKTLYKTIGNSTNGYDDYSAETAASETYSGGLGDPLVKKNGLGKTCNTNIYINKGAVVSGYMYDGSLSGAYAYGGGLGATAIISGSTYVGLHGGTVVKDIYASGSSGGVLDKFKTKDFVATANAYIAGGMVRNVFGGGWMGDVGYHEGTIDDPATNDILGEANVVVGIRSDQTDENLVAALKMVKGEDATKADFGFYYGEPAIQRNAYSGGEGGAVYGTANLTINNGYIGYVHLLKNEKQDEYGNIVAMTTETTDRYEEKLNDETYYEKGIWAGKDRLSDCGNAFGGGYDVESCVDKTYVTMWGGQVRNSLHGGGEIATVGRGATKETTGVTRTLKAIYQPGETHVTMYNGHVQRNVFGGGKGYNIWGYGQLGTRYTDGYVFGKTEVYIHGGEIGTATGVADGYGNVFGGGDIGYVYSKGFFDTNSRKTGTGSPNHFFYYDGVDNGKPVPTEDCKVVVSPYLQVRSGTITDGSKTYKLYDYVPTEYLNKLPAKQADGTYGGEWLQLFTGDKIINSSTGDAVDNPADPVERGVIIHNAVFGGGNVSSNSDQTYANATTVFGNTTATLYDVYYRDFITVGTEHVGGLYGGGNLSVVDGYRELNITNYGTDYHSLNSKITLKEYQQLTNRERAYFQLQYQCQQDVTIEGKDYKKDDRINEDEYNALPTTYQTTAYWKQYGFCSIYAGRLLNTIQRADFCGVFGSRMVLQGAKDRVADVGDATVYTINRVGELSLNKQRFNPASQSDDNMHGNYFGIYSVVNYMGNLTSDVKFEDNRQVIAKNAQNEEVTQTTDDSYYDWKVSHLNNKERNIGTCCNQVALASGVFLELTTENSTSTKKDYGYITGIVELDLINVKKDIVGGGYVYAKNVHGAPSNVSHEHVLLSEYNKKDGDEAFSYKFFTYNSSDIKNYETSGNFIHRKKRIIDDCYPINGVFNDDSKSPAHYWYIKGEVYVYDQNMSAYAGSTNAYSKEVKIPLSITAGSNGKLKLLNVQPSLYAYYTDYTKTNKIGEEPLKVDNESMTFNLNDVITWWDWSQLTDNEQKCFVKETLVNAETIKIGTKEYAPGEYVMLPSDLADFNQTLKGLNGQTLNKNEVFHPSNNIGHDKGYVLTVDWDTPKDWDDWYSPKTGNSIYKPEADRTRIMKEAYDALSSTAQLGYREGPTYRLKGDQSSGLYGQKQYGVGAIISEEVYTDYTTTVSHMTTAPTGQASVEEAYVAKETKDNVNAGSAISKTAYNALTDKSNYDEAWLCINTIQYGEEEYIFNGDLVANGDLSSLANKYKTYINGRSNEATLTDAQALDYVKSCLSHAYYCKSAGLYGGQYFESGQNYSVLKAWCALTDDRDKFDFNYDALDVLADQTYSANPNFYQSPYSDEIPVDYKAAYTGGPTGNETLTYTDGENKNHTLTKNSDPISRIDYETYIPNDQRHYTQLNVPHGTFTYYIATEHINNNGTPYAKGQELTESEFNSLSAENKAKVYQKKITNNETESVVMYFCLETYANVDGKKMGDVIAASTYTALPNKQKDFIIQGMEPTETTTLYVSRESAYQDVTKEKVITVVYQYSYIEDDEGEGVSQKTELHVLNIHLNLESGVPQIGKLNNPPTVKPGETVGLKAPSVNPGLYEIIINGWELFPSEDDALNHRNGVPFVNNGTPLYWYQNKDYHIAFYSKTFLGKTYSDPVPVSVANYHDLADVLADKKYHLHVDYDPEELERDCKIYINDAENGAQQLKSFIDLSYGTKPDADHADLKTYVRGGANLDFILRTDITQTATWTPIANGTGQCFEGTLHGDGHSINGLDNSLFGSLCGDVYNLGVTGSFSGAGIAENDGKLGGYLENCWVKTTGTVQSGTKALFGDPKIKTHPLTNCYYPTENGYTSQTGATAKPLASFSNGEVAYNLNGFYLYKRYCDNKTPAVTGNDYQYLVEGENGLTETTGHYESQDGPFLLDQTKAAGICYVEDRYADGDFIYANGTIPQDHDVRMKVIQKDNKDVSVYYPIWPDDYLFFGQSLTYDYVTNHSHQDEPSAINKNSFGRLFEGIDANRVYRAEGYFGSSTDKKPVHFNPYAVFAKNKSGDTNVKGYEGMTAIDLMTNGAYASGSGSGTFYPPLLDDDGITRFRNIDLTRNLLVYTSDTGTTATTASTDLPEPVYEETNENYRTVEVDETSISNIQGHWVKNGTAAVDHLLVDDNDFNAPIQYTFDSGKRMWYQRLPNKYVTVNNQGKSEGWEDISLPFEVELVTTQTKGELTHFYQDSTTGHEYWLRELTNIKNDNPDDLGIFQYPNKADYRKDFKNTYLWDNYYKHNSYADANSDSYQSQYYASEHTFNNYPLQQAGKPYLIGFPGAYYYEFDLSGQWKPDHTSTPVPSNPGKQTITFASKPGTKIFVSDTELKKETYNGYLYCANYKTTSVPSTGYLLNSEGSKYTSLTEETEVRPFRPYFVKSPTSGARGEFDSGANNILINEELSRMGVLDHQDLSLDENLIITPGKKKICVESQLHYTTDVRIVTVAGMTLSSFSIEPGETVETRVETSGVYIVYADGGKYVKKVIVK